MAQTRTTIRNWMHTKVCPSCGYHGRDVQAAGVMDQETIDDEAYVCPCCGNDLYARPAMSYAEMEGFAAEDASGGVRGDVAHANRPSRVPARREALQRRGVLARVWAWVRRVIGSRR